MDYPITEILDVKKPETNYFWLSRFRLYINFTIIGNAVVTLVHTVAVGVDEPFARFVAAVGLHFAPPDRNFEADCSLLLEHCFVLAFAELVEHFFALADEVDE